MSIHFAKRSSELAPADAFREAIHKQIGADPGVVVLDGKVHRFSSRPNRRDDDAGWYVGYDDGVPAGAFGCWRQGISQTWSAHPLDTLTPAERETKRERWKGLEAAREEERRLRHSEARKKAASIWDNAEPAQVSHPYLTAKGVSPFGIRQSQGKLVVPVRIGDQLASLQFIQGDGTKRFITGGEVKGGFHLIGEPESRLVLVEGYATGATIHATTRLAVAVAFNAGNLEPVGRALRDKKPELSIVIAADDDHSTPDNPGLTKAREAAAAIGGAVVSPPFDRASGEGGSDWNDFATLRGVEAAGKAFLAAVAAANPVPAKPAAGSVILKRAADVISEPIDWLWKHYLARGKFHILGGAPSAGKTTLACALAAIISAGGRFPGGSHATGSNVLIWSGEDDIADTLKPRLEAAGANLDQVHFIDGVTGKDEPRAFDPARDIPILERAIETLGNVSMLILDPVVSAVAGDAHKSNEVRRALQPLVDMVGRHNVAALGITHFSKGTAGRDPTERITGSVAFGALARLVLVAAKKADGEAEDLSTADVRIFTRAKSNIGPDGGGYAYSVQQVELPGGITTTKVVWGDALDGSARELLGQAEGEAEDAGGSSAALAEAVEFLRTELAYEPVAMKALKIAASNAGIADRTLRRACEKVGVQKKRAGFGSGGVWMASIPGSNAIGGHQSPKVSKPESVDTYGNVGHQWTEAAEIEL